MTRPCIPLGRGMRKWCACGHHPWTCAGPLCHSRSRGCASPSPCVCKRPTTTTAVPHPPWTCVMLYSVRSPSSMCNKQQPIATAATKQQHVYYSFGTSRSLNWCRLCLAQPWICLAVLQAISEGLDQKRDVHGDAMTG